MRTATKPTTNRAARLATVLAAAALTAAGLAGCAANPAEQSIVEKPVTAEAPQAASVDEAAPAAAPSPTPQTPCEAAANASGIADTGPREYANGEVTLDSNGYPVKYTVAPGDATGAVAERLCVNRTIVAGLNKGLCPWVTSNPQPGDVWNLDSLSPVALNEYDQKDC